MFNYNKDPFEMFQTWFDEAKSAGIKNYNAMNLATAANNQPSSRIVLLKEYNKKLGFTFYTNLNSRKSREILQNPKIALCFYWEKIGKQIRITGTASKITKEKADEYFYSRPLYSQIGAIISKQSSERNLNINLSEEVKRYNGEVVRPKDWLGFAISPISFEFWQEGDFRLHDRVLYEKNEATSDDSNTSWKISFLYP